MSTQTLDQAFNIFKRITKSDKEALELVKLFQNEVEEEERKVVNSKTDTFATKEDLIREISEVKLEVQKSRADMIKWMFIFWISQAGVMFGFLHYFLSK